jgi:hypothetical protein
MNRKFSLALLSSPLLFSSMLSLVMMTQPARAEQTVNSTQSSLSCAKNPHSATSNLVCVRVSKTVASSSGRTTATSSSSSVVEFTAPQAQQDPNEPGEFKFTEEESDAAVAMFGCDCPSCLNAVRQMRGLPPIS